MLRYTLYPDTAVVLGVQVSSTLCVAGCTPLPEREIVAGDPVALLVTVTFPTALPAADGSKITLNVRLCVGESVTGAAAPVKENPLPLRAICEIFTLAFPVLVTVTLFEEEVPVVTLPKLRLVAVSDSDSVAATPVPLSKIATGEFGAVLTTLSVPVALPAAAGKYWILNVLACPGFRLMGKLTVPVL